LQDQAGDPRQDGNHPEITKDLVCPTGSTAPFDAKGQFPELSNLKRSIAALQEFTRRADAAREHRVGSNHRNLLGALSCL
jgi:hypothetical protein